jgi:CHAD domain-containing protein
MTEIRDLLTPSFPTDDDLHSIRKSLKTLLYTVPFMPIQFHPAESLKSLADLLGELQDLRIGIYYLQPAYLDRVSDEKERADLRLLREEWQEEKYRKQQQAYAWLKQRWAMTAVVTGEQ